MSDRNIFKRVTALRQSFGYAFAGIGFVLRTQRNARLHLLATIIVLVLGVVLRLEVSDWRWILMCIALVWFAEMMNTAFEYVCDVVSPDLHVSVKRAKDIAAGAVLVCAMGAAVIGLMTFWPYVNNHL